MVRDARPEELPQTPYETWGALLFEGDQKKGQIFLGRAIDGKVFGFDAECSSDDKTGAARLWIRARAKVREWGASTVWVHSEPGQPLHPFWKQHGFKARYFMFEGSID